MAMTALKTVETFAPPPVGRPPGGIVERGRRRHTALTVMDDSPSNSETCRPEELLARIGAHQDKAAFVQLFEEYGPRVKAFMMKKGAGEAQAEDLIQDVMLTVWNKAKLYDPAKASVATWLFTIARNRRIDGMRKDRRLEFDHNDPELVTEPEDQSDHLAHASLIGANVREALNQLPEEQAQIVRLSFYEEFSHSEIAARLNMPLGTVKSRVRLAMEKLRTMLGELR